jgi:hypothetical protein
MTRFNDGGPVYPVLGSWGIAYESNGMSLRDAAALAALQGMLAHSTRYRQRPEDSHLHWHAAILREAFQIADAFIAAR